MKIELLNSISAVLTNLRSVEVHGYENIHNMDQAFERLFGISQYLSKLPDEASYDDINDK